MIWNTAGIDQADIWRWKNIVVTICADIRHIGFWVSDVVFSQTSAGSHDRWW